MIKINETNVTIMSMNMDASIAFYESIGFTLKKRWDDFYAMLEAPGLTIGIHPSDEKVEATEQVSIGLMVDSAEEAKKLLISLKIKHSYDDGESGIYLHFNDPDGTAIYFTQPMWNY